MRIILEVLVILLFDNVARGFVFSCEEVKYKLINNTDIELNTLFACLVPSERFTQFDVLENIYAENDELSISFAELAKRQCTERPRNSGWKWFVTADQGVNLDCSDEFTLIFTTYLFDPPPINAVPFYINETRTKSAIIDDTVNHLFVAPDSGMSIRNRQCTGSGKVTVFTGDGSGSGPDPNYPMKSWSCADFPDLLIAFDNVITLSVNNGMQLHVDYDTNDYMNGYAPQTGERIAVMASGRSDDLQRNRGVNVARFSFDTASATNMIVTASCDPCTFDKNYNGSATVTAYNDNWQIASEKTFLSKGTSSFAFNQGLEVRYEGTEIAPEDVWSNNDNFIFELYFGGFIPATTTTAPKPQTDKGPYCGCELDPKFGMPVDWDPSKIWLDIAIILDTSEAMGEVALIDASTLIESFFGSDDSDVLTTLTSATFYTRVGLIAMSDTAEVLYNLNMTKTDKVLDKVQIKKGVSNIDVVDSFKVAEQMLIDGQQSNPDRANVRQAIYYMTDSDPLVDMTPMNQFKASNGIIIVNNFVEAGDTPRPGLKDLASEGYYYNDIQDNYMLSIQLFCKANCYCNADKESYAGLSQDPALTASGGCFHAAPVGVQFSQARSNCEKLGGGLIASVHDLNKAQFLQQSMAKAAPKSNYFWIGYSKSDDNVWRWEDKSTNPYTNWGEDEPSSAVVSKCTYVDTTSDELFWGAGNCNVGFPSVCEFAPCSVGKYC